MIIAETKYIIECRHVFNAAHVTNWVPWEDYKKLRFNTVAEALKAVSSVYAHFELAGWSSTNYQLDNFPNFQFRIAIDFDINPNDFDDINPKKDNPWQIDFEKELKNGH